MRWLPETGVVVAGAIYVGDLQAVLSHPLLAPKGRSLGMLDQRACFFPWARLRHEACPVGIQHSAA
jgi:hypothetical protein